MPRSSCGSRRRHRAERRTRLNEGVARAELRTWLALRTPIWLSCRTIAPRPRTRPARRPGRAPPRATAARRRPTRPRIEPALPPRSRRLRTPRCDASSTAAICLAFVLVPTSLAARRRAGIAGAARSAAAADDPPPRGLGERRLPPAVAAILRGSGLPAKSFAFDVRPVDGADARRCSSLNADQPFLLASTTKLVTSLAALDLLGPRSPLAHERVRDRPGRRRPPRRRPRHRRRPGRPDRQRAAPLVRPDAHRGAAVDRRQHRPRRRHAAARARPKAGAQPPSASALPTRRSTPAPTTTASCSCR